MLTILVSILMFFSGGAVGAEPLGEIGSAAKGALILCE